MDPDIQENEDCDESKAKEIFTSGKKKRLAVTSLRSLGRMFCGKGRNKQKTTDREPKTELGALRNNAACSPQPDSIGVGPFEVANSILERTEQRNEPRRCGTGASKSLEFRKR